VFIEGGMFDSITIGLMIFFHGGSIVQRIMRFPINKGMMRWERERRGIERVDMRSHSIIFLLGNESILLDYFAVALIVFRLLALLPLSLHKRNNINQLIIDIGMHID
jgi:hypothetical protein